MDISLVAISARVAELSCASVFLSSKTTPEAVIKPAMAWLSWNALSVFCIRYAVAAEQRIETVAVTPIAINKLSLTLCAFGCFDLGFAFRTDVL